MNIYKSIRLTTDSSFLTGEADAALNSGDLAGGEEPGIGAYWIELNDGLPSLYVVIGKYGASSGKDGILPGEPTGGL